MTVAPNPAAAHHLHLPFFITAPGQTDYLLWVMGIFLLAIIVILGNFYFKLHALPEHMAHRTNHAQMQIVAVLALLALFTHNHVFWIAGLLLALITLPDFSTPINSIAESLERLSGRERAPASPEPALIPPGAKETLLVTAQPSAGGKPENEA